MRLNCPAPGFISAVKRHTIFCAPLLFDMDLCKTWGLQEQGVLGIWGRNEEQRWAEPGGFNLVWCWLKRMQLLVVRGVRLFSFDRLHCCKYGETWSEEKYIQAGYQKSVWDSQTTEIWEWPWGRRSSSFEVDACSACEMGFVCLGCCGKWREDLVIKGGSSCPQMCFRRL